MRCLILLMLLLLAGCIDSSPSPDAASNAPVPSPVVESIPFRVTGLGPVQNSVPNGGPVDVPANTTAALVEAQWTCSTPTCDLVLAFRNPSGESAADAQGTGSASVTVDAPESGEWNAAMFVATQPADATGEIRVTLFFGGKPPEGYTAFD